MMSPRPSKRRKLLNCGTKEPEPEHLNSTSEVKQHAESSARGSAGFHGRYGSPTDSEINHAKAHSHVAEHQGARSQGQHDIPTEGRIAPIDGSHYADQQLDQEMSFEGTGMLPTLSLAPEMGIEAHNFGTYRTGANNKRPRPQEVNAQTGNMFQGCSDIAFDRSTFTQINVGTDEAKDVLNQIPVNNFRSIHRDTIERATVGTGSWFLDKEEFGVWRDSEGGMLWGIGNPGAGKTFLSSIVIDHLETRAEPGTSVAFVYCRYSDKTTLVEVLTGLLRQQLERDPSLADVVKPMFERHHRENTKPSSSELLKMLNDIAQRSNKRFYVIDALDELPKGICFKLLQALASIKANIFLTSRPLEFMKSFTPNASYVDIAARARDIELFLAEKIKDNPDFCTLLDENGVRDEVVAGIVQKCSGRFLHAALQVESLRHCCSLAELEETAEQLPVGVEELYENDLKRIGSQPKRRATLAKLALIWVINVVRSITFEELQCALSFSEKTKCFNPKDTITEALLLSICCGLITVEKETRLVRLVHFTAKEVLRPLLAHDYPMPDAVIADACISRLIHCDFQQSPTINSREELLRSYNDNPLLEYAHEFWAAHSLRCDTSTELRKRVTEFIKQCHSFPFMLHRWVYGFDKFNSLHLVAQYDFGDIVLQSLLETIRCHSGGHCDINTPTAEGSTALALSCGAGSTSALQSLLGVAGIDVNLVDGDGRTALARASENGHAAIVQMLLGVARIDVNLVDKYGRTALARASENGHEAIVQMLLGIARIDVNLVDKYGRTALACASENGHEAIVQMLLGIAGIDVNLVGGYRVTALARASKKGHEGIVQMLLCVTGIDVNLVDNFGRTALARASENGHEGIVKMLLSVAGIDVNLVDNLWRTALARASSNGHESIVQMLLRVAGIDVNLVDGDGRTALAHASANGHDIIVKMLLRVAGIDVNLVGEYGGTVLVRASENGHEAIVQMLLGVDGIDVNLMDIDGQTALALASRNGHEAIVKMLLGVAGIDVNLVDDFGRTALALASENGHEAIVKMLLGVDGIDVNLMDRDGQTALALASGNGHEAIVQMLLAITGIDVNIRGGLYGQTALAHASENGHECIVQMLVGAAGIDVNLRGGLYGQTALAHASKNGHVGIVKMLLGVAGIDVNPVDRDGRTALANASANSHEAIVQMMLGVAGIDVNLVDNFGWTPLVNASVNGHESVVKILVGVDGIDVNHLSKDGWTALMYASRYGHDGIVQMLLGVAGIDVNLGDKCGWTALAHGSKNGHEGIVQMLLGVAGIDVNLVDLDGRTALVKASTNGHEGIVQMMLGVGGIDVNLVDNFGWTALMYASRGGHEGVVQILLGVIGILANLRNLWGSTALNLATEHAPEVISKVLLQVPGIETHPVDGHGDTALMWASHREL